MLRSISHLLAAVIFTLPASISLAAQDSCPILRIDGPAGMVNVGDIATYRASLDLRGSKVTPTFRWTVSVGEIVSGQGTDTIEVRQPNACITATVEVEGFPDSCPLISSETSCGDPAPDAVKIGEMRDIGKDGAVIKQFAVELENNPNNQGYVFVGHPAGTTQPQMYARERAVRDAVRKADPNNFDDSRITITAVEGSADVVEFWRVPPGASNPKCEACFPLQNCPTITINSPPHFIVAGDELKFGLGTDVTTDKRLEFEWSASLGTIASGQGTPAISVLTVHGDHGQKLRVAVKVRGLPAGCNDCAATEIEFPIIGHMVMADEFGKLSQKDELGRLDLIAAEWLQKPSFYIYLYLSRDPKDSVASEKARAKRIRNHLTVKRKIPVDRVVILKGDLDHRTTQIYMVPADARQNMPPGGRLDLNEN